MRPLLHNFDTTGRSTDNYIPNELHDVSEATALMIVSEYGLFYTDSVNVFNALNNEKLVFNLDYVFEGFDPEITALTSMSVHAGIQFLNNTFSKVLVSYQCVGGAEGENSYLVKELRDKIEYITNNVVPYSKVLNKPIRFPPLEHLHEVLTDLTGLESLNNMMQKILEALVNTRGPINSALRIDDRIDRLLAIIVKLRGDINIVSALSNRRASYTTVGVDRLSTEEDALDGILEESIITPYTLWAAIRKALGLHESSSDPHSQYLIKTDVVSRVEAEEGISEVVKSWPPLRVAQAIDIRLKGLKDWVISQAFATTVWVNTHFATMPWVENKGYVTASWVNGRINDVMTWVQTHFATMPWVEAKGYATQTWVNTRIQDVVDWASPQFSAIYTWVQTHFATMSWVEAKGYVTASWVNGRINDVQTWVNTHFATMPWVENKGYVTASWVNGRINDVQTWVQTHFATMAWVDAKGYATQTWVLGSCALWQNGLSGYITFPNWLGGLIIQWGVGYCVDYYENIWQAFPIAFPNYCMVVSGTHMGGGGAIFVLDKKFNGYFTGVLSTKFNSTTPDSPQWFYNYIAIGI